MNPILMGIPGTVCEWGSKEADTYCAYLFSSCARSIVLRDSTYKTTSKIKLFLGGDRRALSQAWALLSMGPCVTLHRPHAVKLTCPLASMLSSLRADTASPWSQFPARFTKADQPPAAAVGPKVVTDTHYFPPSLLATHSRSP